MDIEENDNKSILSAIKAAIRRVLESLVSNMRCHQSFSLLQRYIKIKIIYNKNKFKKHRKKSTH